MKRWTGWILTAAFLAWLSTAAFQVDETEFAVVTQFGRPVRTVLAAGLQFKLPAPVQTVLRFDRRLQVFETPAVRSVADDAAPDETGGRSGDEFLTRDKKNVVVSTYTAWRIAPEEAGLTRFLQSVRDVPRAEVRLSDLVVSELGATLGEQPFSSLVTNDATQWKWSELVSQIATRCRTRAREDFGVEIVDFQIQRLSFPEQNRRSVFERMRAERERIASQYRSEGDAEARKIRSAAELKAAEIRAAADEEYLRIVGGADAEATRVYGEAYGRDPEFYEFERSLDTLALALTENATAVFSAANRFLAPLIQYGSGPAPHAGEAPRTPSAAAASQSSAQRGFDAGEGIPSR